MPQPYHRKNPRSFKVGAGIGFYIAVMTIVLLPLTAWRVMVLGQGPLRNNSLFVPSLYPYTTQAVLWFYPRQCQHFKLGYTLGTPWVHLGYTLGRVCEIRHKSIKNPWNRKGKSVFSTNKHIRKYQNWLTGARAGWRIAEVRKKWFHMPRERLFYIFLGDKAI